MSFDSNPNPNSSQTKKLNADGTVNIHCTECGQFICKTMYRGFSSVTQCYWCEKGLPRPPNIDPQEELIRNLYNDPVEGENQKKKIPFLDGMKGMFRAVGFRRRKTKISAEEAEQINYEGLQPSEQVAKQKKREPIFSRKKDK